MYNAGIIGCGFIGVMAKDCHARAYKENPETELLFVSDLDDAKARKWADVWEVPFSCPVEPIDIVSICTPPETHWLCVSQALGIGARAIYLEKPIATTLEDADEIIQICKQTGAILQVNHQRRFMNPVMRFSRGLLNTGTHAFDLLRHLFGEIEEITTQQVIFCSGKVVKLEILTTEWPVFELDCCHNKERMIPKGLAHLIECINEGKESISSGENARRALELCLLYEKLVTQL